MEECPTTVTVRRNPSRRARPPPSTTAKHSPPPSSRNLNVTNFPLHDILSIDVQNIPIPIPIPIPNPSTKPSIHFDSLNVFLRVRPLPISKSSKPVKSCLTINDSHSVTISPPLCDSNRLKSEVYNGFSHVFSSDSSQVEVYEKLMRPMVQEFLNGRSALLAALGPTGSGKTHTVFGSAKEPGLLPRALRHIFDPHLGKPSFKSRSFFISIFEIYSEKGKGEKLSDLSPDGSDIYMQQSVVKGLKEILVKDVAEAESLLAHAKLKRATATTNSNSQSSRSQCIINIRYAADETEVERESLPGEAVLTFVDLAGAEREKKTGNKGGRLLESNFINNTSMVFGLCLRSLLEHQKNPKKLLQKHFQSSLLTRYLRDYLEGRKRMALILTVRSGEEDYFDTSFLLRQASPYTEIKFCHVEETTNLPRNKRRHQIIVKEHHKRAKLSGADGTDDVEMTCRNFKNIQKETKDIRIAKRITHASQMGEDSLPKVSCTDSDIQRQYYVMQGFAKALWVTLKHYKGKVKNMQTDIGILTEHLKAEKAQYLVMKKELLYLKSQCSCPTKVLDVASCPMGGPNSESTLIKNESTVKDKVESVEALGLADVECKGKEIQHTAGEQCTSRHKHELVGMETPVELSRCSISQSKATNLDDVTLTPEARCQWIESEGRPLGNPNSEEETGSGSIKDQSPESQEPGSAIVLKVQLRDCPSGPKSFLSVAGSIDPCLNLTMPSHKDNLASSGFKMSSPQSYEVQQSLNECENSHDMSRSDCHEKDPRKGCTKQLTGAADSLPRSHVMDPINQDEGCGCDTQNEMDKENVANGPGSNLKSEQEAKEMSRSKPSKPERPKRRLMPASSLLLRDAGSIDVTDENVKLGGGKGGRRLVKDEHKRTKGNASLLRLLQNHLPR